MPAPRRIPLEKTYFAVTRRVNGRRFMLRPDPQLTQLVTYLLGVCLERFAGDVELCSVAVMSTHYHLVIAASKQRASAFFEMFNAHLAKAVNVLRRAPRGILWEPGGLSLVHLNTDGLETDGLEELESDAAVVQGIAYSIANPSAAGLVARPEEWPGLVTSPRDLGRRVYRASRPTYYFDPDVWPAESSFEVKMPDALSGLSFEDAHALVEAELERLVREATAARRAKGRGVLGARAAMQVSPFKQAETFEHYGKLNPHFKVGAGRREARIAACREIVRFREDYRAAWLRYRAGDREVVFPYGTMRMVQRHHVEMMPSPYS